jgi:hypothetical protein
MRLSIACIHQYRYGKRVSIRFCQAVESHRSCGLRNRLACLARKERQVHKGTQSSNDGGDEQVHASKVKMVSARGQRVQAAWFAAMRNRSMGPSCRMRLSTLLQQSVFKVGSRVAGRVSAANADQNSLVGFPLSPRSHPHDYLPSQRTLSALLLEFTTPRTPSSRTLTLQQRSHPPRRRRLSTYQNIDRRP